jgi:hypothetical protein
VRCALSFAAALAMLLAAGSGEPRPAPDFVPVDVYVDSGAEQIVAYQLELTYDGAGVKVLSLEGGDPDAFDDAPHYDPAGMSGGRMVIAAFTTDDAGAPSGRHRLARLHLRVAPGASADIEARVVTAARPGGERIPVDVELK